MITVLFVTFCTFLAACTVPKNKHSAPILSERIRSVAASCSIKFELIGYSLGCLCSKDYNSKLGGVGSSYLLLEKGAGCLFFNFILGMLCCCVLFLIHENIQAET